MTSGEDEVEVEPRRLDWLVAAIGWDGCLPLLVAVCPLVVPLIFPNPLVTVLVSVLLLPFGAAFARVWRGSKQLERRGLGENIGRQLRLGVAIIVVLFFELFAGMLLCLPGVTNLNWFVAVGLYLLYLGLVGFALRPPKQSDNVPKDFDM